MTVIAWDGDTLASDKRCCDGSTISTTTKIRRIGNKLVGIAGNLVTGLELISWFKGDSDFPEMEGDRFANLLVIDKKKVYLYENSPIAIEFEDPFFAIGSGRDYAMAAMHLGTDAREAVRIASIFDADCGNGIDVLPFKGRRK